MGQIQALEPERPLNSSFTASCVTLYRSLNRSELQLPHLQKEGNEETISEVLLAMTLPVLARNFCVFGGQ